MNTDDTKKVNDTEISDDKEISNGKDDPFGYFSEWKTPEDEAAFASLQRGSSSMLMGAFKSIQKPK